jgi:hypothetical protein
MLNYANEECRAVHVASDFARAFFQAATKLSDDSEDILPQEDGMDQKLSVFHLFSELFPEYANDKDRDGGNTGKTGLMRLQFNRIGYEVYEKGQSRRVPAASAKPGYPGYGFRRARWRDTMGNGEDRRACENVLRRLGINQERQDKIQQRISDFRKEWDNVRRPSRPAGPGRRGHKRANPGDPMEAGWVGSLEVRVRKQTTKKPCKAKPVCKVPTRHKTRSKIRPEATRISVAAAAAISASSACMSTASEKTADNSIGLCKLPSARPPVAANNDTLLQLLRGEIAETATPGPSPPASSSTDMMAASKIQNLRTILPSSARNIQSLYMTGGHIHVRTLSGCEEGGQGWNEGREAVKRQAYRVFNVGPS